MEELQNSDVRQREEKSHLENEENSEKKSENRADKYESTSQVWRYRNNLMHDCCNPTKTTTWENLQVTSVLTFNQQDQLPRLA